jgi:hypothetical protein
VDRAGGGEEYRGKKLDHFSLPLKGGGLGWGLVAKLMSVRETPTRRLPKSDVSDFGHSYSAEVGQARLRWRRPPPFRGR